MWPPTFHSPIGSRLLFQVRLCFSVEITCTYLRRRHHVRLGLPNLAKRYNRKDPTPVNDLSPFYLGYLEAKVLFYEGRGSDEGGESPMPDDERSSVSNRRIETLENTYTISVCISLTSDRT